MRAVAVGLVVLVLAATVVVDAAPALCAVAGLAGAVCLSVVFARTGPAGVHPLPAASVAGAAGFAVVAMVVDVFAVSLPWLPLIAPLAALALFGVVLGGLARPGRAGPRGFSPRQ
ncbi:hypothetical protein [Skermania piniformis]|uniref:Integral membrane protein n=1 Tax=Skermania pinensis TaxID=39122 RepID=A0ABX8S803_9ACTN|nr:hypothetical protein [Skermania piniformis]QXQ13989.1 hypothetical protein KV203_00495 [Skermania piniformis]